MFLVPYFWNIQNPNWATLGLFLMDMGTARWGLEGGETEKEIEAVLLENGFPVVRLWRPQAPEAEGLIFAEMDVSRLKLENFYLWKELSPESPEDSEKDCWFTFQIPKKLWTCKIFQETFWKSFSDLKSLSELLKV
jgi:hypothetical protein